MKPYGRSKKVKGWNGKIDYHIHSNNRKLGSWWEGICNYFTRGRIKQITKKEISNELNEKELHKNSGSD